MYHLARRLALLVAVLPIWACKTQTRDAQLKDITVSAPSMTCTAKWSCASKGLKGEISDTVISTEGQTSSKELDPARCESLLSKKLADEFVCGDAKLIPGTTTSHTGESNVTMISDGMGLGKRIIEQLDLTKAVIKRGCDGEDCQPWINEIEEQAILIGVLAAESAKLSGWCADHMLFEIGTYGLEKSGFGFCDVRFTGTMSMCQDYTKALTKVGENIKRLCRPSQRHLIRICPVIPCRY